MYVGGRLFCLTMADADRLDDAVDETIPTEAESAVPIISPLPPSSTTSRYIKGTPNIYCIGP